jgi:hypothetical protein
MRRRVEALVKTIGRMRASVVSLTLALTACGDGPAQVAPGQADAGNDASITLRREELLKPESCGQCHPVQYREWSSSMHAYAANDPVFIAMNTRGQRETNNALGDFCVRCHAPMALVEKKTTNGANLAQLPSELKGVTCYFCHNAIGIEDDHNGALKLANDTTMRGSFKNPPPAPAFAHSSAYASIFDRNSTDSSALCGACHDVVTPKGVHMERTFKEYNESLYPHPTASFQTCQTCHMDARHPDGPAAQIGKALPVRRTYEHMWPGIDVALTDFPYRDAQRAAVQCALADSATVFALTLTSPLGEFKLELETEAGHAQPSGSAHDRRMWVEFVAYDDSDAVVYQSGVIADDQVAFAPAPSAEPTTDPTPWSLGDQLYDAAGQKVHFFWEAEKSSTYPNGYTSGPLKPLAVAGASHTVERTFRVPSGMPARVTVRLRVRPIGLDILEELVRSGDLDPKYLKEMPTFTLDGTVVEWKRADGYKPVKTPKPPSLRCPDDYRCLLQSDAGQCASVAGPQTAAADAGTN